MSTEEITGKRRRAKPLGKDRREMSRIYVDPDVMADYAILAHRAGKSVEQFISDLMQAQHGQELAQIRQDRNKLLGQ